jgi:hypothetical protein
MTRSPGFGLALAYGILFGFLALPDTWRLLARAGRRLAAVQVSERALWVIIWGVVLLVYVGLGWLVAWSFTLPRACR